MSHLELKGLKGLRNLNALSDSKKLSSFSQETLQRLPLNSLAPGRYQPRKHIDDAVLLELAESIKSQGIIQPLIVRPREGRYEIIAGERRWRAAKLAGLAEVPCVVREVDDNTTLAFALIENIQRENLNPIEEAEAFERFQKDFSMTHSDIAEMVGKSRTTISNALRLLALCEPVKLLLMQGRLEMGHARALLTLSDEEQLLLANQIVNSGLSVREAEKLVQATKLPQRRPEEVVVANKFDDQCSRWASELCEVFSSKVTVTFNRQGSGRVVIHVDSPDEIEWLLEHISIK